MTSRRSTIGLMALLAVLGTAGTWMIAADIAALVKALQTGAERVVLDGGRAIAAPNVSAMGLLIILISR